MVLSAIGVVIAGIGFDWYAVSVNAVIFCFWVRFFLSVVFRSYQH